jgi:DNA (cytosine-5)-methyltransferase 1
MVQAATLPKARSPVKTAATLPTCLDFFAGSGLVTEGMRGSFVSVWANDICGKKAAVYCANHGQDHFHLGSISEVKGADLPAADLAWASFPCQDLSLAGQMSGFDGKRSSLVWEWLRVIDEMGPKMPAVLVAENVTGLVSGHNGDSYRALHAALEARGYRSGAMELDAVRWVPQSRPRIFVVSVRKDVPLTGLASRFPSWTQSRAIQKLGADLPGFIWWDLPLPAMRETWLEDVLEEGAECHDEKRNLATLALIAPQHQTRLRGELANGFKIAPGYRRTRAGKQVLELRFDRISGCLRTPEGGSSRQILVLKKDGQLATRLLTVREAARLMGVRDDYQLPGSYNDGYKAMGDAVAVPVVRHLAQHLLKPLAIRTRG